MIYVEWLQDLGGADLERVGGKAAQLGELLRAGLPVPPGFVLTTDAYQQFVTANSLHEKIEQAIQITDPQDPARLDQTAQHLAQHFATRTMPEAIATALREAYQRMGSPPVAVRSSATAEDLPTASFAGQMESYLNVRGEAALLAAVRRCWASLWTPRAIAYRASQGIPSASVRLAVVVQELLAAEAAGVLFTANPVSGHRGQMTIDAVWGLGEALVSGRANPDHWRIDARTGKVLESRVVRKETMTAPGPDGTATVPVPADLQERPVLDEAQIAGLVDLGRQAARHFGMPQDIEWVVAKGRLYLVQARAITSLFPLPRPEPPPEAGLRVYLCFNVLQGIVEPLTPMGISLFRNAISSMAAFKYGLKVPRGESAPAFKAAAGTIFFDITVPLRHPRARRTIPHVFSLMDAHVADILKTLLEREPRLAPESRRLPVKLPAAFVLTLLVRILFSLGSPDAARRRMLVSSEKLVRHFEQLADQVKSPSDCRALIEVKMMALWPVILYTAIPVVFPVLLLRFLTEGLARRWLNDPTALQPVLRSLPHNPTMIMDLELWRISRVLKAEGVEPSADHPEVRGFLARYGHRAVREIDIGMPRWREEPEHILTVLRTYLRHGAEADPERQFRAGAQAAEKALVAVVERVRRSKGPLRAKFLEFVLRRVRALAGLREFPKFMTIRILAAVRRAVARTGAQLVAEGRLDREEDVFFLDLNFLDSSADLWTIVRQNRAEYERELGRRRIPRVMTSEGETFYTTPHVVPGALVGTAASAGSYEGTVRVILDPRAAQLEPGEVLVAPSTDPAWTPLFLTAGALVMELGGVMSHGSVVAREYGIPAVVGVPGATQRLRTGQRVRVDGEAGQVLVL